MMRVTRWTVVAWCAACATASAGPRLTRLYPPGGQRGTTVRVEASGAELGALTGVVDSETGLTVRLLPSAGEGGKITQTLEVAVAPDAPLGKHELRVFDRTGASNPKYFWVGELPEVAEQEPNNDWSEAQHVTPPVT